MRCDSFGLFTEIWLLLLMLLLHVVQQPKISNNHSSATSATSVTTTAQHYCHTTSTGDYICPAIACNNKYFFQRNQLILWQEFRLICARNMKLWIFQGVGAAEWFASLSKVPIDLNFLIFDLLTFAIIALLMRLVCEMSTQRWIGRIFVPSRLAAALLFSILGMAADMVVSLPQRKNRPRSLLLLQSTADLSADLKDMVEINAKN